MQAAQQQRQQYEAALPALLQRLQAQFAGDFPEIKSQEDIARLAVDDPLRYIQFKAKQDEANAYWGEMQQAQQRAEQEQMQSWNSFSAQQDALFAEKVPDASDPNKAQKLKDGALKTLKDVGFTTEEVARAWSTPNSLSLRDARIQQILVDAVKYRTAQSAVKIAPPKPVPQVVKPGVATGRDAGKEQRLKALDEQLNKTGSLRDAAKLLGLRRSR